MMGQYSNYGQCVKCGAGIKHIYTFNGEQYGSSCIEKVLGFKVSSYGTRNVNKIIESKEGKEKQFKLNREQQRQAVIDRFTPLADKLLASEWLGDIGDKLEIDVLVTEKFGFEGRYGYSKCIKMIDDNYNQIISFTTAKWINDVSDGDRIKISGIVKQHNVVDDSKCNTINVSAYGVEKWSERTGNCWIDFDSDKCIDDGHSVGIGIPYEITDDIDGYEGIDQTVLTRIKKESK